MTTTGRTLDVAKVGGHLLADVGPEPGAAPVVGGPFPKTADDFKLRDEEPIKAGDKSPHADHVLEHSLAVKVVRLDPRATLSCPSLAAGVSLGRME